jgi:hypothetical protein
VLLAICKVTHEEVHNKYFAATADCECAIRNRVLFRLENNAVFELCLPYTASSVCCTVSQLGILGQNYGGLDCVIYRRVHSEAKQIFEIGI